MAHPGCEGPPAAGRDSERFGMRSRTGCPVVTVVPTTFCGHCFFRVQWASPGPACPRAAATAAPGRIGEDRASGSTG